MDLDELLPDTDIDQMNKAFWARHRLPSDLSMILILTLSAYGRS